MTAAHTAKQRLSLEMRSVRFGNQADRAGNGEAGDLRCPGDRRERFRFDVAGVPQGQVTRTRKSPKHWSSRLM